MDQHALWLQNPTNKKCANLRNAIDSNGFWQTEY